MVESTTGNHPTVTKSPPSVHGRVVLTRYGARLASASTAHVHDDVSQAIARLCVVSEHASDECQRPRFGAVDVAGLRREAAEFYGGDHGMQYYLQAILADRQPFRPDGSPPQAAAALANAEAERLHQADLWYVDDDLCALVAAAHPTMPAFTPQSWDLPSRHGFAVFAEPLHVSTGTEHGLTDMVESMASDNPALRSHADEILNGEAGIVAVSWGPVDTPLWRGGGVWLSFYAESMIHKHTDLFDDPRDAMVARNLIPTLTVDNEAAIAWPHPSTRQPDAVLPGPDDEITTASWARLVFAAFQLSGQGNLSETTTLRPARPERRRTDRAGLPVRDVRVIRLRPSVTAARTADESDATRQYRHRWIVRGHWRNHWYPAKEVHRPKWIAPYLKGPQDAPLLGGDRVTVINAPPASPEA